MIERIAVIVWSLGLVLLDRALDRYIEQLRKEGKLSKTQAALMEQIEDWLMAILQSESLRPVIGAYAKRYAELAARRYLPNDPSTGAWG